MKIKLKTKGFTFELHGELAEVTKPNQVIVKFANGVAFLINEDGSLEGVVSPEPKVGGKLYRGSFSLARYLAGDPARRAA